MTKKEILEELGKEIEDLKMKNKELVRALDLEIDYRKKECTTISYYNKLERAHKDLQDSFVLVTTKLALQLE